MQICQIPHVIFESTSQFSFKFGSIYNAQYNMHQSTILHQSTICCLQSTIFMLPDPFEEGAVLKGGQNYPWMKLDMKRS